MSSTFSKKIEYFSKKVDFYSRMCYNIENNINIEGVFLWKIYLNLEDV